MSKKIVETVAMMILAAVSVNIGRAQTPETGFEAGGQFTLVSLSTLTATTTTLPCLGPLPCPVTTTFARGRETDPGFGGRLGYNFSRNVALEVEGNFFPRDRDFEGGRKIQGLFGVKAGKRVDGFGLFAKARPGFIRYEKGDYRPVGVCIAVFPPPIACFEPTTKTNFALDIGGVAEWYPSTHTIIRFDVGDTIVHFGERNVAAFDVPAAGLSPVRLVVIPVGAETKHNFQASVGVGYRF
jgi:hypothetical protein